MSHKSELKTTTTTLKEPFLNVCAGLANRKILRHRRMAGQVDDQRVWKGTGHKGGEI